MRKTRIAIVGAGLAATPHALALNESNDEVEVVGVVGRSPERLKHFASTHGFPVSESFDAVLNDRSVDARSGAHSAATRISSSSSRPLPHASTWCSKSRLTYR